PKFPYKRRHGDIEKKKKEKKKKKVKKRRERKENDSSMYSRASKVPRGDSSNKNFPSIDHIHPHSKPILL
ncbi:hypothetical protein G0P98_27965, partial [Yangia sp. PrR004]|nr:hypothetical protein [Salipiger sp. PrR004]